MGQRMRPNSDSNIPYRAQNIKKLLDVIWQRGKYLGVGEVDNAQQEAGLFGFRLGDDPPKVWEIKLFIFIYKLFVS